LRTRCSVRGRRRGRRAGDVARGPMSTTPWCATRARTWSGIVTVQALNACGRSAPAEEYVGECCRSAVDEPRSAQTSSSPRVVRSRCSRARTLGPAERACSGSARCSTPLPKRSQRRSASHPAAVRQIARGPATMSGCPPAMPSARPSNRRPSTFFAAIRHGDCKASRRPRTDVVVVAAGGVGGAAVVRSRCGVCGLPDPWLPRWTSSEAVWLNGHPQSALDIGGHVDAAVSSPSETVASPASTPSATRTSSIDCRIAALHGRNPRVPRALARRKVVSARAVSVDGVDSSPMPTRRLLSQRAVEFQESTRRSSTDAPEHVEHGGGASAFSGSDHPATAGFTPGQRVSSALILRVRRAGRPVPGTDEAELRQRREHLGRDRGRRGRRSFVVTPASCSSAAAPRRAAAFRGKVSVRASV